MPSFWAANVWASFVKNAVTASVPSVPSDPVEPPSTLKTFIVSDNESFETSIVTGKFNLLEFNPPAFKLLENDILPDDIPLCFPLLFVTLLLSNEKLVTLESRAVLIVISLAATASDKFCWLKENIILDGSADVSDALSNENTCESTDAINDFALDPFNPLFPSLPPCTLNNDVVSVNESPLTVIDTGKLSLSVSNPPADNAPANVILPDTIPLYNPDEFTVILPVSKLNPVTLVDWAVVIVILLADILAVKFCCVILNIILDGVAVLSDALSNAIICESDVNVNDFAVFEAVASFIASWTFWPSSNLNCPLTTNADPSQVNLSPNEKLDPEST